MRSPDVAHTGIAVGSHSDEGCARQGSAQGSGEGTRCVGRDEHQQSAAARLPHLPPYLVGTRLGGLSESSWIVWCINFKRGDKTDYIIGCGVALNAVGHYGSAAMRNTPPERKPAGVGMCCKGIGISWTEGICHHDGRLRVLLSCFKRHERAVMRALAPGDGAQRVTRLIGAHLSGVEERLDISGGACCTKECSLKAWRRGGGGRYDPFGIVNHGHVAPPEAKAVAQAAHPCRKPVPAALAGRLLRGNHINNLTMLIELFPCGIKAPCMGSKCSCTFVLQPLAKGCICSIKACCAFRTSYAACGGRLCIRERAQPRSSGYLDEARRQRRE